MDVTVEDYVKKINNVTVIDSVYMKLTGKKLYCLEGANGSGKTMLLRAIAGLIKPTSGSVRIDGKQIGRDIAFPPSLGALIGAPSFIPKYSGLKNLLLLRSIKKVVTKTAVADSLRSVGLDPTDKKPYRKYSMGMTQRLGIACAIMENPQIVLLDEPFNTLDSSGIGLIERLILDLRAAGKLVVVVCHSESPIKDCSDVRFKLEEGRCIVNET